MSQHYIFNESGSIPGIPGTFAGVRVDVADDGTVDVQPLPLYPHFVAAEEEEEQAPEGQPGEVPPSSEQSAPKEPPEQQPEETIAPKEEQAETTEPEQPTSPPATPVEGSSEQA